MKSKKYIKQIEKNGFTLIPGFLSKSKVKRLTKLVNNFYEIDAKRKNPTFNQHKNKDKTVYNLQYKDYQFVKLFSNKVIKEIAKNFLNDPFYQFLKPNARKLYS